MNKALDLARLKELKIGAKLTENLASSLDECLSDGTLNTTIA
jgi:hypothetical protein